MIARNEKPKKFKKMKIKFKNNFVNFTSYQTKQERASPYQSI
jgi:phage anti-repressor protein